MSLMAIANVDDINFASQMLMEFDFNVEVRKII